MQVGGIDKGKMTLSFQQNGVTGSKGNPAVAQLTVRAVPYEQDRKGKEEDTG